MGTYIFSGERELGGENLQALNSLHNKKAELLKKASAQADATSVDKGGIFDGGSIDEQYSKKLAEYKDAYAQQTGFLGKATDLARNGLNAIGIGKGGTVKTKKEQAELEAAYAQLEAARKSGKGIEQAEELVKKELADSEKQIERRKDGNEAWVEGIATMASITAGFVVTALTKGKVSAGMATASTVKTFLKGGDELTSKDGEGYTLKEGIRDAATGAVDFGFAYAGNAVGGLVRGKLGKAAGLAAGRLAEGVFDAGSGAGVETVTQIVEGKGLDAGKIGGAAVGAGIAGTVLGGVFDIGGVGMRKVFGKSAKNVADGVEVAGVKTEANSFITTRIPADEVKPKKFIVIDSNDDVVTYLDISNGQKLTHAEMAKRLAKAKGGNNVEVEALYLASETTGSKQGRGFDVNLKELDGIFDNILKRKNAGENIAAVNMSFGDEISISRLAELTDLPLTSQNLKEYAETARAEILKRSEIAKEGRRLYNEVYMPARTKVDEYKAQYATSPQGLPKEIENEIAHLNNIVRETSAKLRAMGDDSVIDKYQECDRLARRILQVEKLTSNGIVVYNSAGNGGAGRINTISLAKGVKSIGTCDNTGKAFGYSANNGLVSFRNQPEIMYSFDANGKIDGYVLKGEEVPFMKVDEIEGFKPWQNDYLGELPDKHLLSEADIAVLINDPKLRYNKQYSHKLVPTKDYRKIFPPTNSIQEQSVQNIEKMNGLVTVNGIYHFIPDENGRLRFAKNEPCATPVGTSFTSPLAMVEDFIEQSGGTMPTNALHNGVEVAGVKTEANPFAKAPDNKFKAFSAAVHAEGKAKYDEAFNEIRNALPEDLRNSLVGRTKGVTSINDRLIREAGKGKTIETVADAIVAIPDLVGTRLILDDASPAMIDKIVDSLVDAIKKGDLKVTEIENYRGANGKPYFTEVHLDKLKKADPEIMVLEGQKATKKSGYTTTQLNIKAKNGANVEFQIRGKQINELAEAEHLAHDLRMGKDLSKGIKELAELYKPLETVVKSMDESQNKTYTNYLAAMYDYTRSREMGMPAKNPTLSEGLDKILSIESLKDLHHRAQEIVSAQKLAA